MRVFLDECVDWRLARDLIGHQVMTTSQMGWSSIENGRLLALAAQEFDAFITVDRNLSYQQNLTAVSIPVIVLRAASNRLAELQLLVPELLAVIAAAKPGSATIVGQP